MRCELGPACASSVLKSTCAACCVGLDAGAGERAIFAALDQLVDDCTRLVPEQRPTMEQVLGRISSIQMMYAPLLAGSAAAATARAEAAGDSGSQEAWSAVDEALAVDSRTGSPDAAAVLD